VNFSRLFILRPVATTLLMLALLATGLLAWRALPVAALPQVDYPTIQVTTLYPGASPQVMAALVTSPLERQFGQMAGLQQMRSSSSGGSSVITLQFDLKLALDIAEQEVQAAINAASNLLPNDLPTPPIYHKVNPADAPVISLAVTSPTLPLHQVRDLIDVRVAQKLSQIAGVGQVSLAGGQRPAVRIAADPQALAARGLTLADVRRAIASANVNQPKGSLEGPQRSISIDANDQLRSVQDYENLIIIHDGGAPLRLRDVATIRYGAENTRQAAWIGTTPAVLLNIQKQPGANVIDVADRVNAMLPSLQSTLPAGVDVTVAVDRTHTIRDAIAHVQREMLLAMALVVLVTLVFLRSWTATLIPGVVVPLSIVGTFTLMWFMGFSINTLTLMALTIAAGFVVDDAIVMVENIARHVEAGFKPLAAAVKGARQIGFTLLSLTISLVAVLIPLLFMQGVIGRLFSEFAMTLAVAILLSLAISLTLTPMMCARLLRGNDAPAKQAADTATNATATATAHTATNRSAASENRLQRWAARCTTHLAAWYERSLDRVLVRQHTTLWVALATLGVTVILYLLIPKGFFPQQDTGLIQVISQGPQSVSFQSMAQRQQQLAERLLADPDVAAVSSFIGIDGTNATLSTGRMQIALTPAGQRVSARDVLERLLQDVQGVADLHVAMQPVQDLTVDDAIHRAQYQLTLSSADPDLVSTWTQRLTQAMRALPLLAEVAPDWQNRGLGMQILIDRDTASRLGVTVAAINEALYDAFGQRLISTIFTQSTQYRVVLETPPQYRGSSQALETLYIATPAGAPVPLSSMARIVQGHTLLSIERQGQFPAATIAFDLAPGVALSDAMAAIAQARHDIGLPTAIDVRYQGAAKAFAESQQSTLLLLLAAVVVMYLVLGVLYESFIHPVTILSTLPSATVGALLALLLTGHALDMIGVIGIILLIGIVKKNAIMMIDFALDAQRQQGLPPIEAIRQAALLRFRPILMTTLAALFAAIPLMLATGPGAQLRQPLGIVMVGGLLCSQLLTVFTTPVIYLMFDRFSARLHRSATAPAAALHATPHASAPEAPWPR